MIWKLIKERSLRERQYSVGYFAALDLNLDRLKPTDLSTPKEILLHRCLHIGYANFNKNSLIFL